MNEKNKCGQEIINKALEYANYEWYATEKNIKHGIDDNGVEVDTLDITWQGEALDCGWWQVNQKNIGIPYGWGRASTIEEFEKGIVEGKYATRSTGKVSQRQENIAELFNKGYKIYRKK